MRVLISGEAGLAGILGSRAELRPIGEAPIPVSSDEAVMEAFRQSADTQVFDVKTRSEADRLAHAAWRVDRFQRLSFIATDATASIDQRREAAEMGLKIAPDDVARSSLAKVLVELNTPELTPPKKSSVAISRQPFRFKDADATSAVATKKVRTGSHNSPRSLPRVAQQIDALARSEPMPVAEAHRIPDFAPGDTVRVNIRISEGDRERLQAFEGLCVARSGTGVDAQFTVRKLSFGEGVERVFPLHSPVLESIEVRRKGRVRRSKLYYLRGRTGKRARIADKTGSGQKSTSEE